MANKWTAVQDTEKLTFELLGEQVWIEVRRELSIGEKRKIESAGFRSMVGFGAQDAADPAAVDVAPRETEIKIDWKAQSFAKVEAWLVGWSLADERGDKLPLLPSTLRALKPVVYEAIDKAVSEWAEAQEKKVQSGAPARSAT